MIRALLAPHYNCGAPKILITEVARGELHLQHEKEALGDLDERYAEKTMAYIFEPWKNPVVLETPCGETRIKFTFGQGGFHLAN